VCVSSASTGLCGGWRVTGIPTATPAARDSRDKIPLAGRVAGRAGDHVLPARGGNLPPGRKLHGLEELYADAVSVRVDLFYTAAGV